MNRLVVITLSVAMISVPALGLADENEPKAQAILEAAIVNGEAWKCGDAFVTVRRFCDTVQVKPTGVTGVVFSEVSNIRFLFDYERGRIACYCLTQFEIEDFGGVPRHEPETRKGVSWYAASLDRKTDAAYYLSDRFSRLKKTTAKAATEKHNELGFRIPDYRGLWKTGSDNFWSFQEAAKEVATLQNEPQNRFIVSDSRKERTLAFKTKLSAQRVFPAEMRFVVHRQSLMPSSVKYTFEDEQGKTVKLAHFQTEWDANDGIYIPTSFQSSKSGTIPHIQRQVAGRMETSMSFNWNAFGKGTEELTDGKLISVEWVRDMKDISRVVSQDSANEAEDSRLD